MLGIRHLSWEISKNFKKYGIISFANLRYSSSHLASEDVTRDRRVSSRQRIHLQEVERANGMVLGWGKCWTFDLSQPRFQHLVRHDFRLPANVSALQLSPVGVTSQYTTERTTDKQFTALTALNTVLLSLREYKKTTENDTILQWSTFSLTELSRMCVITCSRHGNGIGKSAIWQVSLAVRKREIYHRNRYLSSEPYLKNRCTSPLIHCTTFRSANDCWDILPKHDVTEFVKKDNFCRKRLACRARETHLGRARAAKRDTRARPKLCHVCVESDRDRLRLFYFRSTRQFQKSVPLALALPLNLKSRALFFPGDWCWILNGRSYRRDDGWRRWWPKLGCAHSESFSRGLPLVFRRFTKGVTGIAGGRKVRESVAQCRSTQPFGCFNFTSHSQTGWPPNKISESDSFVIYWFSRIIPQFVVQVISLQLLRYEFLNCRLDMQAPYWPGCVNIRSRLVWLCPLGCVCIDILMASKTVRDFVGRVSGVLSPPKLNASLRKTRSSELWSEVSCGSSPQPLCGKQ